MSILERSILALKGKKSKNILLLVLMVVIFMTIFTQQNLSKGIEGFKANTKAKLSSSLIVEDYKGLKKEKIRNLEEEKSIKSYSYEAEEFVSKGKYNFAEKQGAGVSLDNDLERKLKLIYSQNTEISDGFIEGAYRLVKGEHISKKSKNAAMVHQDFAKANNLKIGDKLRLGDKSKKGYTIKGIFKGTTKEKTAMKLEEIENTVLLNYDKSSEKNNVRAIYILKNSDAADTIKEKISKLNLKESAEIFENSSEANKILGVLDSTLSLISKWGYGLSISLICILVFVLIMYIRWRLREIGIYLSLGKSKGNIIGQLFCELAIVGIGAMVIAIPLSIGLIKILEKLVFAGIFLEGFPLSVESYFAGAFMEVMVIIGTVLIGTLPILRLKPREIFTKFN